LTVLAVVLGLITIPIHALLLRQGTAHASAAVDATAASLSLGQAARTAVFWVLSVAFLVSNFATAAVTTHLIPFLVDRGYAAASAPGGPRCCCSVSARTRPSSGRSPRHCSPPAAPCCSRTGARAPATDCPGRIPASGPRIAARHVDGVRGVAGRGAGDPTSCGPSPHPPWHVRRTYGG